MVKAVIIEGLPKSGRFWKVKEMERASTMKRQGIMSHMAKSFEQKQAIRAKKAETKAIEQEMIEVKKGKILAEKQRREAQTKRRMENEYKTATYQTVRLQPLRKQEPCLYIQHWCYGIPYTRHVLYIIYVFFYVSVNFFFTVEPREIEGNE